MLIVCKMVFIKLLTFNYDEFSPSIESFFLIFTGQVNTLNYEFKLHFFYLTQY